MKTRNMRLAAALLSSAAFPSLVHADQQTNRLKDIAKLAETNGDLDQAASALCQAAKVDPQHYTKKCARVRADADQKLQVYSLKLAMSKSELQQKDYLGAIRDLSTIKFGPNKEEAQQLLEQAEGSLPGAHPESTSALRAAQVAYLQGNFDLAAARASQVMTQPQRAAATQILTNIKTYSDTMAQADTFVKNREYERAQQLYMFAVRIKANGPGNPSEKLQQLNALIAQQAAVAARQPMSDETKETQLSNADYTAKIKAALTTARRDETSDDMKGALQAFNSVLALDERQAEAIAGRHRILARMQRDPKALADSLETGIRSYYAAQFDQATQALTLYLSGGGMHDKGAAHFYLAASLVSQAVVADPKDIDEIADLQQKAQREFVLAKQASYRPVEKLVSPKIIAEWSKIGSPR
ncbi:hypothetical protein [Granulicella sp. L60]|uniref:hypothetical protein n=1 Tax=Granulicella sp. L60 TaxID=1641866 RepID=UPI00131B4FEB|nr:hypothetical protein [Granulicella sp. L60]